MYIVSRHMQTEAKEKNSADSRKMSGSDDLIIRRQPAYGNDRVHNLYKRVCNLERTQARLKRVFCRVSYEGMKRLLF